MSWGRLGGEPGRTGMGAPPGRCGAGVRAAGGPASRPGGAAGGRAGADPELGRVGAIVGLLTIWGGAAGRGPGRLGGAGRAPPPPWGRLGAVAERAEEGVVGRLGAGVGLAGGATAGRPGAGAAALLAGAPALGGSAAVGGAASSRGFAGAAGPAGRRGGAVTAAGDGFTAAVSAAAFFSERIALPAGEAGAPATAGSALPPLPRVIRARMRSASSTLIELLWLRAAILSLSAASSTSLLSRPRSRDSS